MIRAIARTAEAFGDFFLLYPQRMAEIRAATNGNNVFGDARFKAEAVRVPNRRVTPDEKPWFVPEVLRVPQEWLFGVVGLTLALCLWLIFGGRRS